MAYNPSNGGKKPKRGTPLGRGAPLGKDNRNRNRGNSHWNERKQIPTGLNMHTIHDVDQSSDATHQDTQKTAGVNSLNDDVHIDGLIEVTDQQMFQKLVFDESSSRLIVCDFTTTWCPPSVEFLPTWRTLCQEYRDYDVLFLTVTTDALRDSHTKWYYSYERTNSVPEFHFYRHGQLMEYTSGANKQTVEDCIRKHAFKRAFEELDATDASAWVTVAELKMGDNGKWQHQPAPSLGLSESQASAVQARVEDHKMQRMREMRMRAFGGSNMAPVPNSKQSSSKRLRASAKHSDELVCDDSSCQLPARNKAKVATPSNDHSWWQCQSSALDNCEHVTRVISALGAYHAITTESAATDIVALSKQWPQIMDDFAHLAACHNHEMRDVHKLVEENGAVFLKCSIAECAMYRRRRRDRCNTDGSAADTDSEQTALEPLAMFWTDFFDSMHSFVVHLYDSGLRNRGDELDQKSDDEAEEEEAEEGADAYDDDPNGDLVLLPLFGSSAPAAAANPRRFQELSNSNLDNNINRVDDKRDKFNVVMQDASEEKDSCDSQVFSVGYRFFYWDYYKTNGAQIDDAQQTLMGNENDLCGHSIAELCVATKYANLQQDVISNSLSKKEFDVVAVKAEQYMDKAFVKLLRADGYCSRQLHYGIAAGSGIRKDHLMAILLYTDCSALCTAFSQTFRRIKGDTTLECVKKRNSEFANWARLLRESVELFGQSCGEKPATHDDDTSQPKTFYSGMSGSMLMQSFNIRLSAPTSTSTILGVASRFALHSGSEGIILQLTSSSNARWSRHLHSFNCTYLSNFPEESEWLFFGGFVPLGLESVTKILPGGAPHNLAKFVKPLFYFDCCLSAVDLMASKQAWMKKKKNRKLQKALLQLLIDQRLGAPHDEVKAGNLDQYVRESFEMFCSSKTQVTIDTLHVQRTYEALSSLTLFDNNDLLMATKLEVLAKLFGNCKSIVVIINNLLEHQDFTADAFWDFVNAASTLIASGENSVQRVICKIHTDKSYSWIHHYLKTKDISIFADVEKVKISFVQKEKKLKKKLSTSRLFFEQLCVESNLYYTILY